MNARSIVSRLGMAAAAVVATASIAHAEPSPAIAAHQVNGPLECDIEITRMAGSVRLSGRLWASAKLSGHAGLTVAKSGPAGSSNLAQSDRFVLAAGAQQVLGTIRIALEPGAHLTAKLTATADAGLDCVVEAPIGDHAD